MILRSIFLRNALLKINNSMLDKTCSIFFSIFSMSYISFLFSFDLLFIAVLSRRLLIAYTSHLPTLGSCHKV